MRLIDILHCVVEYLTRVDIASTARIACCVWNASRSWIETIIKQGCNYKIMISRGFKQYNRRINLVRTRIKEGMFCTCIHLLKCWLPPPQKKQRIGYLHFGTSDFQKLKFLTKLRTCGIRWCLKYMTFIFR